MKSAASRRRLALAALALVALAVLLAAPFAGMHRITPAAVFGGGGADPLTLNIFRQIRVPRTLLAFLAGAALAVSGMAFQAMFRNPLATPYTLGVSSGASLGAALAVRLGWTFALAGVPGTALAAFGGALLSVGLVYGLTRVRHGFSTPAMLLAGVAVNLFFSSLILFIQYLSDFTETFRTLRWLMGGIQVVGFEAVLNVMPFAIGGGVGLWFLTHELNLMMTGDDLAMSRGVPVAAVKKLLFLLTSLMVGVVVAFCGPIGFVGMMAPHICRLLVGANHRYLLPATFVFGGAFLTACDTVARTLIAPAEIPVGVITSLLGGPFFVWLLLSRSAPGHDPRG